MRVQINGMEAEEKQSNRYQQQISGGVDKLEEEEESGLRGS